MEVEEPKNKFSNLTNSERRALYDLKIDESIVIKSVVKGLVVVVWQRQDYIRETEEQVGDKEVYE